MNGTCKCGKTALTIGGLCAVLLGWLCGPGTQTARAGTDLQWAWMKGADTVDQSGYYGTQGTPVPKNHPGARYNAVSWTDPSGVLWLFGGRGRDGGGNLGYLNDLWKYDRTTGNWVWMKGDSTHTHSGTYGALRVEAISNSPGTRSGAVSWTDASGVLWLFGGIGRDSAGSEGKLNDLWKYDRSSGNWTWMKGAKTVSQSGTYGAIETPATGNTPGARWEAVSWVDASGALWLFGGFGLDAAGSDGRLNDLWKYDMSTNKWAWIKGASTVDQAGTYGALETPVAANKPGARYRPVAWADATGALWLFGGYGRDNAGVLGYLNDLWKYNPTTGNWAWMKGADTAAQSGTYGTLATPAEANIPGARENAVSWTDNSGALWLFGGYGKNGTGSEGRLNDLWKYDLATGYWAWMKGSNTVGQSGTYGTLGNPAADNTPGARDQAVAWTDPAGALWLFGGFFYVGATPTQINDLWRYAADTTPPTGAVVVNNNQSVTNNPNVTLSLTWNDGLGGSGVSRMKFSNDAVTWTAWEPLAATKVWTLPAGEGYKTVRAMFRDVAGNNSIVYNDYIRVDTIAPTGGIIINGGASSTKSRTVSLGLTWSDGTGSGVTRMRFSIDGATWSVWEPLVTPKSYTLPATPGYYTVRVTYRDAGGNISERYSDYIKLVAP